MTAGSEPINERPRRALAIPPQAKMFKKVTLAVLAIVITVAAVVVINTLRYGRGSTADVPAVDDSVDAEAAAERLAATVRFKTVSYQDPGRTDPDAFRALHAYPRVSVRPLAHPNDPSPVSSPASPFYQRLGQAIHEVSPEDELVVAPYLVIAQTDSRHFAPLADVVYRLVGARVTAEELAGFHGTDESLAISEYARVIKVFYRFLRLASAG